MSEGPIPKLTYRQLLEKLQSLPEEAMDKEVRVFLHTPGDSEFWGHARQIFMWDHEADPDDDEANRLGVLWDLPEDVELTEDVILEVW
jgi:DNA gyrase inhibitor GyrI